MALSAYALVPDLREDQAFHYSVGCVLFPRQEFLWLRLAAQQQSKQQGAGPGGGRAERNRGVTATHATSLDQAGKNLNSRITTVSGDAGPDPKWNGKANGFFLLF
jgi:hypothetical protein